MSNTACMYPVFSAVRALDEFLGPNRMWHPVNERQDRFVAFMGATQNDPLIPEIISKGSRSADVLNKFLREHGFSIELRPFPQDPRFKACGAASVLDLKLEWQKTGKVVNINTPEHENFSGVELENITVFPLSSLGFVACVPTKSNDVVYLTMHHSPFEGFALLEHVRILSERLKSKTTASEGILRFPMVDMDQEVDISWLKGMTTKDAYGDHNEISQALQQTKLKMNEKGARVKSAAAVGAIRSVSVRIPLMLYVIDKPFLMWIERPGLSLPLFAGYITKENWKNPGTLEM